MADPLFIETRRLTIRWLRPGDADFILELLNDPDWIRYIGDRSVHCLDDARDYIEKGPADMYRRYGFGLNRVALKAGDRPVGICGLLRREALPEADLGFALLPGFRGQGYACEAAQAVVGHGFEQLGLPRIVAIVTPRNRPSRRLLRSLGFGFEREIEMEPKRDLLDLYVIDR